MNVVRVRIVWDLTGRTLAIVERRFTLDAFGNPIPSGRLLRFEINGMPITEARLGIRQVSVSRGTRLLQATISTAGAVRREFDLVIETR